MPDRVDPTLNQVEPPAPNAQLDRASADTERRELRSSDDAVLTRRQGRDRRVRSAFTITVMVNCNRTRGWRGAEARDRAASRQAWRSSCDAWGAQCAGCAYDFGSLDAERPAYVAYWPQLAPRGLLAVDNAVSHEHELLAFTALVEADDRVTGALVPVGAGLRLAVRA